MLVDGVEVMNVTPVGSPQKQPAMNDTEKVKRTRSRVNTTGDAPHSLPNMDDLNLVGYFRVYLSLTWILLAIRQILPSFQVDRLSFDHLT